MKNVLDKISPNSLRGVCSLYGASFAMALTLSVWWTAMPFIIRNIGGTESHVGYAMATNMLGYMVCLLIAGTTMGEHNPKNATRTATAIIFASVLLISVVVYFILSKNLTGNLALIWTIIATGTVAGAAMSLYWPFLMSWASEDLEGAELNRRLGAYNGTWSGAAIIGPLVGGILVETSTLYPIVFAAGVLIICFLFLNVATDGSIHKKLFGYERAIPVNGGENGVALIRFRWIARIALFCSWSCLGVARSQFALLFTDMNYSETWFGILITIFGICNFSVLMAAGRCAFWHFKSTLLLAVQVLLALSLVLIIYSRSLPVFVLSFVIMGCGFGFAYSSHLYYGAYGSRKRSVQMIIHEGTISAGIIVGSGGGGYLAKNVGPYSPYWFALALMVGGLLIQIILLLYGKLMRRAIKK